MNESQWDKLLHIKTTGRDDSHSDQYRYPYEPTSYSVLERLANSGYIRKDNILIDYGCGKGRVSFFFAYQLRCHCIGIEYDERISNIAVKNKVSAVSASKVDFINAKAEEYSVPAEADRFYFFNPFSAEILKKVMARIRESYDGREKLLLFYYPSDEYIAWLMTVDDLMFVDEIDCGDLFDGNNSRERIMIFGESIGTVLIDSFFMPSGSQ